MIAKYVERFEAGKAQLQARFEADHPENYEQLVTWVIETIADPDEYEDIDPKRIHVIDDGDYQGTLLFVIGANNYQPYVYWYVMVDYGSCSGCDTLEGIRSDGDPPNERQVKDYMTLALHVVQGLKQIGGVKVAV